MNKILSQAIKKAVSEYSKNTAINIENNNQKIEIKHINNRTGPEACSNLIKYDSIHGKFNSEIKYDEKNLIINKKKISFSQETEIKKIKWKIVW